MEFKTLLKNTSFLAGTRMVQFLTGLVRTKLIAYYLGTLGAGLVAQLTFVTQKMSQFTLLSMSEALVKQIAENLDSPESVRIINSAYKAYILLLSFFVVLSSSILYFFADELTIYVFGEVSYISYFYIGLLSFPVLILDSIPFSILKAFKDVKTIARARIIIVIINLILAVPLILFLKLDGAIMFVPLSYIANLAVNFFFAQKIYFKKFRINLKSIFAESLSYKFVKELLVFSTFGLTVGVFSIISEFVCRGIVVSNLGVDSIGLYSPIVMWASMVTGFILPSFSTYLYPRFCELKSKKEISSLLNDAIRLGTFSIFPLLLIGIPYKDFFISLFYSNSFLEASKYLPFHFLGVAFYVWYYVFSQSMTPTGRIKQHGFFMVLYFSIDMLVTYIFVERIGLYGWMLKHLVSPVVFFLIYFAYSRIYMGFTLQMRNVILMSYLLIATLLLIAVEIMLKEMRYINYFLGPLLLIMIFAFLRKNEKKFLLTKFKLKRNR